MWMNKEALQNPLARNHPPSQSQRLHIDTDRLPHRNPLNTQTRHSRESVFRQKAAPGISQSATKLFLPIEPSRTSPTAFVQMYIL
jgi:hypothetical protein